MSTGESDREELFDWAEPVEEEPPVLHMELHTKNAQVQAPSADGISWSHVAETSPVEFKQIHVETSPYVPAGYLTTATAPSLVADTFGNSYSATYSGFNASAVWKLPVAVATPQCKRVVIRCELADGKVMEFECPNPSAVSVETQPAPPVDLAAMIVPGTYYSPEVVFRVKGGLPYNLTINQDPYA